MNGLRQGLLIDQLDAKIGRFNTPDKIIIPSEGWIHAIRRAIRMSLRQLGSKIGLSPQGVKKLEEREKDGSITIKRLFEVGKALDMTFVYGFIPNDGSISHMIEKRLEKAASKKKEETVSSLPRNLWD